MPHPGGALGDCRLFDTRDGEKVHVAARLIVIARESGQAVVVTYRDFGCVQHTQGPRN